MDKTEERCVDLYSWWTNKRYDRVFTIIEKIPFREKFGTSGFKLLELGQTSPIYYEVAEFFDLVDKGSFIEVKPRDQTIQRRLKSESKFLNEILNYQQAQNQPVNAGLKS